MLLASGDLAAKTVRDHRETLAQIIDEAIKTGAIMANSVRAVAPPSVAVSHKDTMGAQEDDAKAVADRATRLFAPNAR